MDEQGRRFIEVEGYAFSGGGRGVHRLDVSVDGGKNWSVADLKHGESTLNNGRKWDWSLFKARMYIDELSKDGAFEIICKAIDTAANSQPESAADIYNLRGVCSNTRHKVKVEAVPT